MQEFRFRPSQNTLRSETSHEVWNALSSNQNGLISPSSHLYSPNLAKSPNDMSPRHCIDVERNSSKESAKFCRRPSEIKQIQQQLHEKLWSIKDDCEEENQMTISREDAEASGARDETQQLHESRMIAEVGRFKLNLMDIPGNANGQSLPHNVIAANSQRKLEKVSADPAEIVDDKKNNG